MTKYWPFAIVRDGNAFQVKDIESGSNSIEDAEDFIRQWADVERSKIIAAWIDVYEADSKYCCLEFSVNFARVKDLWAEFIKVPTYENTGRIMCSWGIFGPATAEEYIYQWFEDTFSVSVPDDLMGHEHELDWDGLHFELVDKIPKGYTIWNIADNMPDGYLLLVRMKSDQPFEGAREIDRNTMKAIRTDGAKTILKAIGYGPVTADQMEQYIKGKNVPSNLRKRMLKAIPILKNLET